MNTRLNLVQRARAGDAAAMAQLIEQSRPAVFRLALALLDDRRQAAKVEKAAARAVMEGLQDYSGAPAYFIWLYQIVNQICRSRLRRQRLWQRLPAQVRAHFHFNSESAPPEAVVGLSERQELIARMVNRLEEKLRLALVLRYDQGLQINEIAPVLNWRELNVQARLKEARERVCNALLEVPRGVEAAEIDEIFSHRIAQELIQGSADGLMKAEDARRLKDHLEACAECQAFAGHWKTLEDELCAALHARWDQQAPPQEVNVSEGRPLPHWLRLANLLRAGTAALVVIMAAALLQSLSANRAVLLPPPTPAATLTPRPTLAPIESRSELLGEIYPGKLAVEEKGNLREDIVVIEPKRGRISNLTPGSAINSSPVWSPDGQRIAYLNQKSLISNQIMLMSGDGGGNQALLSEVMRFALPTAEPGWPADPRFGPPRWSPDGRRLAAGIQTSYSNRMLAVLPVAKDEIFQAVPVEGLDLEMVEWSPDGRMLAYACHDNREVWVWQPDPKLETFNTHRIETYRSWDITLGLAWSPDSSRLAILSGDLDRDKVGVNLQNVTVNLRIYRASGVLDREVMVYNGGLANPASRSRRLAWSPDGKYLAFSGITSGSIQLIQANGSGLHTLAEFDEELGGVAWSPDGRWLAFPAGYDIWAVSLDALEMGEYAMLRLPLKLSEKVGSAISWQVLP